MARFFAVAQFLVAQAVVIVAGGHCLAVVGAFERRLVVVLDLVDFLLVAVIVLGLAGVALVLVVFVWHGFRLTGGPHRNPGRT
ncbi:hypothetical protein GO986_11285 [Deinococcus sp. HMF7620]|uniref:Uncharacterized protein n=1 Tax=Deinococcus arboris TaxID=2682977 RepID=A0A7C9I3D8_9DEIO|nr:hypothetical protein [Deinococcus arboris]